MAGRKSNHAGSGRGTGSRRGAHSQQPPRDPPLPSAPPRNRRLASQIVAEVRLGDQGLEEQRSVAPVMQLPVEKFNQMIQQVADLTKQVRILTHPPLECPLSPEPCVQRKGMFQRHEELRNCSRAFPTTLVDAARDWYAGLRPNSISSFEDLVDNLVQHFMSSRRPKKIVASLMSLRQERDESLKDFVCRLNREALQITNLDPSIALNALLSGAKRSIARKAPTSLADLIAKTEKYISVEDTMAALNNRHGGQSKRNEQPSNQKNRREDGAPRKDRSPPRREENYTPLNTSRARILATITYEDFLRWLAKMLSKSNKRDKSKYYRYHKDHGNDTNECRHLKEEIELLIKRGHLRNYVKGGGQDKREPRFPSPPRVGGPTAGGGSSAAWKAYARQLNSVHIPDKKLKVEKLKADNTISFAGADLNNVILPHNDALVITMLIANFETPKILVDNGSSADVLYYQAFKQLGIKDDLSKPSTTELYGFAGEVVKVVGTIELPVLVGHPKDRLHWHLNLIRI
ncbi:uncharacterized protein LOC143882958 [Tasmannia lanceolata]|uniref:uncharacterized protein LOC143882958 n=1 Tax=Tasmannia lanceolata TaxID=3420 RepID=UPI0040648C7A